MASNVPPHSLAIRAPSVPRLTAAYRDRNSWPSWRGQPFIIYEESAAAQTAKELTAANRPLHEHDNKENVQPSPNGTAERSDMGDWADNEPLVDGEPG